MAALPLVAFPPSASAGRNCEQRPPTARTVELAMALAERTARHLDASGARVVVLARAGKDLSTYGLRYSHLGFAYRADDRWRVAHKLNRCGTAHADLYRQGLGEFFLDDLWDYEAGIVVLSPEVQASLLPVLASNAELGRLHTPHYNMVAYPWSLKYQQSNQWATETLAMAHDPAVQDRRDAQAWLMRSGYRPTTLNLGPLTRLGARTFSANIAFDDHPNAKRFTDRIETVTVDSVFDWLQRSGLGVSTQRVR
jgi:hypothetical protein